MSVAMCQRCGRPLDPGARFCGGCGLPVVGEVAAARAQGALSAPVAAPAFPIATGTKAAAWQRPSSTRVQAWVLVIAIGIAIIIAAGLVGWIIGQGRATPCSGPGCGPLSAPLGAALPYASAKFGYSLDATARCGSIETSVTAQDDASIDWTMRYTGLAVNEWPLEVRGEMAGNRSAEAIVESIQKAKYADATFVYAIPMAELGYAPGYGAVYDLRVGAGSADPIHARAVVIAAVKGDLAITLDSVSPFVDKRVGHPFPAQTYGVICYGPIINSVTWPGEPPP